MSVSEYSGAEVAKLYAGILGLKGRIVLFREDDEVREALGAAYVANRAAMAMTYGDVAKLESFGIPDQPGGNVDPREVYDEIGLLMYNCISNGGRDFLPEQDRAVLQDVQKAIARYYIDQGGRSPVVVSKQGGDKRGDG
ncbi:MAG: hypothetical protein ACOC8H_01580 [bacterium]